VKLPEVEYAPVQESSSAYAVVDQAQRQAAGTIAAGLDAFGREMVKTQSQQAAARVQAGLADLEAEIHRMPYLTTEQVRQQLGGSLDSLDPATRAGLTTKMKDVQTGEFVDVDRTDIPMWSVAGPLFEKRAKDLVKAASGAMTIGQGWQSQFEAHAGEDVVARKARLVQGQLASMLADQRKSQDETVDSYIRAGNWGAAKNLIASSQAFQPAEKEQLAAKVRVAEETKPIYDALQLVTVPAYRAEGVRQLEAAQASLGDPANLKDVTAEHRAVLAHQVRTALTFANNADRSIEALSAVTKIEQEIPDPAKRTAAVLALPPAIAEKALQIHRERENARVEGVKVQQDAAFGTVLNAIESGKVRGTADLENLPAFGPLDDGRQARARAYLRQRQEHGRTLSAAERQAQADQDATVDGEWSDLLRTDPQAAVALNPDVEYAGRASAKKIADLKRRRLAASNEVAKGASVSETAYGAYVLKPVEAVVPKAQQPAYIAYMQQKRMDWMAEPANQNKSPPRDVVDAWIGDAVKWGDKGGLHLSGNKFRFQTAPGEEFEPFAPDEQKYKPTAPAPAVQPVVAPKANPGTQLPSEALGLPAGGVMEMQANGKWKRVK
jgi:hypothetical protein